MNIGYARTSTVDQVAGMEAQLRDLKANGVEKIFSEHLSSVDAERPELARALEYCRDGDVLVVTKLDRLARSVAGLVELEKRLAEKGVGVKILNLGLDTSAPTGKLMVNLLAAIAQFEREMMLERQKEGIAKAKAEGKYKGRAPTARAKSAEVIELLKQGMNVSAVSVKLRIGKSSVRRIMEAEGWIMKAELVSREG